MSTTPTSLSLATLRSPINAAGGAAVFAYYDDPFTAPGSSEVLRVGPASWPDLLVPDNQCGGSIGQRTGYGQSPIVIPKKVEDECDTNLDEDGYIFEGGDCAFDDLKFDVLTNGVIAGPRPGAECSLGRMKIPGGRGSGHSGDGHDDDGHRRSLLEEGDGGDEGIWYEALQLHVHANSEHSVDGKYYPAELHIVHRAEDGKDYAVYATFIDKHPAPAPTIMAVPLENEDVDADSSRDHEGSEEPNKSLIHTGTGGGTNRDGSAAAAAASSSSSSSEKDEDFGAHSMLEHLLTGWEAVSDQTNEYCAANPSGSGMFTPNRLFTSKQQVLECPRVGHGVSRDDVANLEWVDEYTLNMNTGKPVSIAMPALKNPDSYPEGPIPQLYSSLSASAGDTDVSSGLGGAAGLYTYRGGLTSPPCTEIVRWHVADRPAYVSSSQLSRLSKLILCFVERSTCRHATVASVFGGTNRPPQPLHHRRIVHRCPGGPDVRIYDHPNHAVHGASHGSHSSGGGHGDGHGAHHVHPHWAILFPWFVMALGLMVYYVLSRFCHALPYTAILFILGTFMGVGIVSLQNTNQLSASTAMWASIDSHTLLLVFLPGLLFRDAFCLNVYLLKDAIVQCLLMAFPMVLAGTTLLALVGYYVLPYGWSFNLCMTFGAILSATDPVAVSALLNEVGAPPRLKMHIAGESLLNDGSAIVFYTIFASMFLYELGIPGLGEDIGVAGGFALFFKMSLGAAGIGLAFGIALVRMLHHLNRRYNAEESVVQVTASITVAYLTYYVAEAICHTSGVLAVVMCGVVTKGFGDNMINDKVMMEKFWLMVEHLLNTLIFALGGVVWGTVISNSDPRRSETFSGTDWGYLFLVYLLMMVIRSFLFAAFFPVISRIGLRSNWKEAVFISFGGLRGAVGIAMAIALDNELNADTVPGDPRRDFTSQLFGLTGGIALLTLMINGSLCGPLLRKLGLADSTEMREKIVEEYRGGLKEYLMEVLLGHLADPRYEKADFVVVRRHVPSLKSLTSDELKLAVKRHKANTPTHEYKKPNLESFRSTVGEESMNDLTSMASISSSAMLQSLVTRTTLSSANLAGLNAQSTRAIEGEPDEREVVELRKLFIELLRFAYKTQIEDGEVEVREGLVVFTLEKSLEYAEDAVAEGGPICDWEKLMMLSHPWETALKGVLDMKTSEYTDQISTLRRHRQLERTKAMNDSAMKASMRGSMRGTVRGSMRDLREIKKEMNESKKAAGDIQRAVAFIAAHQQAQKLFKEKFCGNRLLTPSERAVLDESRDQTGKAEELIKSMDDEVVENVVSHLLCTVLLNKAASYIGNLVIQGLLKEREGEEYMHELVEHELHEVHKCVKSRTCLKGAHDDDSHDDKDDGTFEDEPTLGEEQGGVNAKVDASRNSNVSLTSLKEGKNEDKSVHDRVALDATQDETTSQASSQQSPEKNKDGRKNSFVYLNPTPSSEGSLGGINF